MPLKFIPLLLFIKRNGSNILVKVSHLVEIFHEMVIVLTSYADCHGAKSKVMELYVYMSNFLN